MMLESLLYQWNLLQRNTLYFTSPGRGSIPVDFCKSKCALSYKLRPFNFFFHFNLNFNFKIDLVHEERIFLLPRNNPTSLVREMNAHFSLVPHPPERPSKEIPVPPPERPSKDIPVSHTGVLARFDWSISFYIAPSTRTIGGYCTGLL